MKKLYTSPELEVVRYSMVDVLLGSPTDTPTTVFDEPELPDPGGEGLDL